MKLKPAKTLKSKPKTDLEKLSSIASWFIQQKKSSFHLQSTFDKQFQLSVLPDNSGTSFSVFGATLQETVTKLFELLDGKDVPHVSGVVKKSRNKTQTHLTIKL